MSAKDELLADEDRGWHLLCEGLAKLDDQALTAPGFNGDWSVKDLMAHIASWHASTVDRLEALRATGELPPPHDVDAFNDKTYNECKDLSLHDVRAMFESSRHRFREEVAELPGDPDERLQRIIAANGLGHYDEHVPDLTAFLEAHA